MIGFKMVTSCVHLFEVIWASCNFEAVSGRVHPSYIGVVVSAGQRAPGFQSMHLTEVAGFDFIWFDVVFDSNQSFGSCAPRSFLFVDFVCTVSLHC